MATRRQWNEQSRTQQVLSEFPGAAGKLAGPVGAQDFGKISGGLSDKGKIPVLASIKEHIGLVGGAERMVRGEVEGGQGADP